MLIDFGAHWEIGISWVWSEDGINWCDRAIGCHVRDPIHPVYDKTVGTKFSEGYLGEVYWNIFILVAQLGEEGCANDTSPMESTLM